MVRFASSPNSLGRLDTLTPRVCDMDFEGQKQFPLSGIYSELFECFLDAVAHFSH